MTLTLWTIAEILFPPHPPRNTIFIVEDEGFNHEPSKNTLHAW